MKALALATKKHHSALLGVSHIVSTGEVAINDTSCDISCHNVGLLSSHSLLDQNQPQQCNSKLHHCIITKSKSLKHKSRQESSSSTLRPKLQVNCPNLKPQNQACIQPSDVEHPSALGNNSNVDIALREKGLVSIDVEGDKNCFFRAVSVCMDGVEDNHIQLRRKLLNI